MKGERCRMNAHTMVKIIGLATMLGLALLIGCASRNIEVSPDNMVTAVGLNARIAPEFNYLGKVSEKGMWGNTSCYVVENSHFFGRADATTLDRGVIVKSQAFVNSSYTWAGDVFRDEEKEMALKSGKVEQNEHYSYIARAPLLPALPIAQILPLREYERNFLKAHDYATPKCALVKIMGTQVGNDQRKYITYFEALSDCDSWMPDSLTGDQQALLEEFLARSEDAVMFQ